MSTRARASLVVLHRCSVALLCGSFFAVPVAAQTPSVSSEPVDAASDAPSDDTNDVARVLFERGKAKWAAGDFAEAAILLAASHQQLPRAGTAMLLADAYERSGRLRAALDSFRTASRLARDSGNTELEHRASTREAALLPRLSQLEVRVSQPIPSGLLVTLNGVEVPAEQLNAVMFLDAGKYVIEARAPGYRPFHLQLQLTNDVPQSPGARVVAISLTRGSGALAEAEGADSSAPRPSGSDRDTLAWWVGGAGGALVLAGVVSMIVAASKNGASKDHCGLDGGIPIDDADLCTERGADLRGQARTFAHLATAFGILGVAGIGAGVTLHFTAGGASEPEAAWVGWSAAF